MGLVYSAGQGCEMQLVYSRSEILFFLRGQPSKKSAEASFYTPLSLDFVTHLALSPSWVTLRTTFWVLCGLYEIESAKIGGPSPTPRVQLGFLYFVPYRDHRRIAFSFRACSTIAYIEIHYMKNKKKYFHADFSNSAS